MSLSMWQFGTLSKSPGRGALTWWSLTHSTCRSIRHFYAIRHEADLPLVELCSHQLWTTNSGNRVSLSGSKSPKDDRKCTPGKRRELGNKVAHLITAHLFVCFVSSYKCGRTGGNISTIMGLLLSTRKIQLFTKHSKYSMEGSKKPKWFGHDPDWRNSMKIDSNCL